jgi:hypothetical protein
LEFQRTIFSLPSILKTFVCLGTVAPFPGRDYLVSALINIKVLLKLIPRKRESILSFIIVYSNMEIMKIKVF